MGTWSPGWNISVITGKLKAAKCEELANALLYGDKAIWLPTLLPFLEVTDEKLQGLKLKRTTQLREEGGTVKYAEAEFPDGYRIELEFHQRLREEIASGTLPIEIPKDFLQNPHQSDMLTGLLHDTAEKINFHLQETGAFIAGPEIPFSLEIPSFWNPDKATQALTSSLSKILLPDVASLPLVEVAEMREKVKDELNPMRGELLRLTEDLRKMVKDECSEDEVAWETENIIKTRVESVLFEADRHIKDQLNNKWKKFQTGALKTIGFVGGGYFLPDLLKEAIKTGVETAANTLTSQGQARPSAATTQFVLELRRHYNEKYNY